MTPLTTLRTTQLFQMSCPLISSAVGIRIGSTAAAWLAGSYIWPSRFGIFAGGGVWVSPELGWETGQRIYSGFVGFWRDGGGWVRAAGLWSFGELVVLHQEGN
jgi:hypothetical protein